MQAVRGAGDGVGRQQTCNTQSCNIRLAFSTAPKVSTSAMTERRVLQSYTAQPAYPFRGKRPSCVFGKSILVDSRFGRAGRGGYVWFVGGERDGCANEPQWWSPSVVRVQRN